MNAFQMWTIIGQERLFYICLKFLVHIIEGAHIEEGHAIEAVW